MLDSTTPLTAAFAPGSPEADAELVFRYLDGRASIDEAARAFARIGATGPMPFGDDVASHDDESPESRHVRERIMSLVARLDGARSKSGRAD